MKRQPLYESISRHMQNICNGYIGTPMVFQEQWYDLPRRRLEPSQEDRWESSAYQLRLVLTCAAAEGNPDEEKIGAFGVGQ